MDKNVTTLTEGQRGLVRALTTTLDAAATLVRLLAEAPPLELHGQVGQLRVAVDDAAAAAHSLASGVSALVSPPRPPAPPGCVCREVAPEDRPCLPCEAVAKAAAPEEPAPGPHSDTLLPPVSHGRMDRRKHSEIARAVGNYPLVLRTYGDPGPIIKAAEEIAATLSAESEHAVTPVEVLAVWVEADSRP